MTKSNEDTEQVEGSSTNVTSNKSKWEKIEILARPISSTLTALAIAAIGYFGNQAISTQENARVEIAADEQKIRVEIAADEQKIREKIAADEQKIREKIAADEQNARLYTQLLSGREESESALRKDMFKQILEGFFAEKTEDDSLNGISKRILKLEMLALNFGDSLSLGPLFAEVSRDIDRVVGDKDKVANIDNRLIETGKFQKRLQSLSKRVAAAQLATIIPKGESIIAMIKVPANKETQSINSEEWQYTWPDDYQVQEGVDKPNSIMDSQYSIVIQLSNANYKKKTVDVILIIEELNEVDKPPTEMDFTLDYFNLPMIDNTRLKNNQRFAIVMNEFSQEELVLTGVLFPGIFASQRDKPYLNEAIENLKKETAILKNNKQTEAAEQNASNEDKI